MSTFTSRLPKSTSARRPSNPNDGSTSIFGSHIPVSVRKANLFTPQPKRSIPGGLNSTSRKSYLNTDKKYQRPSKPAPDRDEQIRMFENMVEFLKEREPSFPVPEAKRFFSSVSTTECSRIFEFLISRVYDDFKINKLELDVPDALASLEYPYIRTVTKSALVSITTRQAIINLLVIFDWLVGFCRDSDPDESAYADEAISDSPIISSILSNPSEPFEELDRRMNNQATGYEPQIENLESAMAERDRLAEQWDEYQKLEVEFEALEGDLQECQRYESQISDYLNARNEQLQLLRQRNSDYLIESEKIRSQLEKLSPIVDLEQPGYDSTTYDDLTKKLEIVEEEVRNERQFEFDRSEIVRKELDRKKGIHKQKMNELRAEKMAVTESFDSLCGYHDKITEANSKQLRVTLGTYKMEIDTIVNEAKARERILTEVSKKVKANNKIVRAARRKLLRGSTLSKVDEMNKP